MDRCDIFNLPNCLTVLRIGLTPLFLLLLFADTWYWRSLSFAVFTLAALTDFYDGKLAREGNQVTSLGRFLDPLADKIVVIGGAYCLVYVERYWWVPVTIIAVRELGITAYRSRWARDGLALPARTSAKYKTFVQALALILAVMPTLENHDTVIAVSLWVAVGWTIYSGVQYLLDGQNALSTTGD